MKKEWFITISGKKKGAYTFEELIKLDIYDDSMVWKSGWSDWKQVTEVEELKNFLIQTPPPLMKEVSKSQSVTQSTMLLNFIVESLLSQKGIKYFFYGLVSGLILNYFLYIGAKDGGSDLYPIYLTNEERANPMIIFWNFLPYSLTISIVLFVIIFIAKSYKKYNDLLRDLSYNQDFDLNKNNKYPQSGYYKLNKENIAYYISDGTMKEEYIIIKEYSDKGEICGCNFFNSSQEISLGSPIWLNGKRVKDGVFLIQTKAIEVKDGLVDSIE